LVAPLNNPKTPNVAPLAQVRIMCVEQYHLAEENPAIKSIISVALTQRICRNWGRVSVAMPCIAEGAKKTPERNSG
jgi:hypothetical protein